MKRLSLAAVVVACMLAADVRLHGAIGKSKLLSHDNTIRRPTDAIVPGLASR